jgi:signal transduction histidine kinase
VTGLDGAILKRSENLGQVKLPENEQALSAVRNGDSYLDYTEAANGPPFLVYSAPLRVNDTVLGAVQIIQPVGTAVTALNQVSRYLTLGTAISLILAAIVGAFLAQRALAPIDTITNTAGAITRTHDLGKRIQIADNASEVGRLAGTFNDMLDRIQQLFQTQERLIGDVSHELRTPLTTVQGNIDLLQRMAGTTLAGSSPRDRELNTLLNETLIEVKVETERMGDMISDLLLLAQADSGALQLQLAPVEMDTLLLDVYRQTRRLAEHLRNPGELEVRLGSEDQALVNGDRDKLRQVVLNLAENAVKYTPAGGTVTLGLEHADGWVKVAVQDTGIGISDEQQQLIFERFYRTDKARSRELGGSGLGLSIAQSIAHAHGGKITVTSKLGVGSTFVLWLPELVNG